jgi:hypothetical protein
MTVTKGVKCAVGPCFVGDDGRPIEIGIQVQVSNRLWVLQPKVVVLSANGKGHKNGQVSAAKLNESEEPTKRRKSEHSSQNQGLSKQLGKV